MSSSLYKIGTIYSRVNGLIRKKAIPESDTPIWLEVYERFPPKYEPTYGRPAPNIEIKQIFYPEDKVRAELHSKYSNYLGVINMEKTDHTNSQRWINTYNEYIVQGMSEKEAMEKLCASIELRSSNIQKKGPQESGTSQDSNS